MIPTEGEFDHVAHAGPHIRDLVPIYRDLLGARPLFGGANEAAGYRAVHFETPGGTRIELLDPLPGSRFLDGFLASRPSGGLHHLTFRVRSLRDALARTHSLGIETFGEYWDNDWQFEAFIHPRDGHGVLFQLIEKRAYDLAPFSAAELETFLAGP